VCSFQILIRWTLRAPLHDQVLTFAWKFMFPLALAKPVRDRGRRVGGAVQ